MKQKNLKASPKLYSSALGYRMPAEWEPHKATWLAWPHDLETWPDQLAEVEDTYVQIIEQLYRGEEIHILVEDGKTEDYVFGKLGQQGIIKNVFLHQIKTDSIWIRDYGPIFLVGKSGELALTNWEFNAWGRKYDSYESDNGVPEALSSIVKAQEFKTNIILEGGSVDVNGLGTCMITEQCLLNPNRNKDLNRQKIEQCLKDFLGVRHFIWLGGGIAGDDTDGHIDDVARFVDPRTVVTCTEEGSRDENFKVLRENLRCLSKSVDQDGNSLNVVNLPMPEKVEANGMRFPASYANFYIANKCVLVPIFRDKNDTKALGILKDLFPGRNVIGIPAIPLIYGQGAIHCITQQEPIHET